MESEPELKLASHLFRYEQLSRNIDSLNNIEEVKAIAKLSLKLYISQQEFLINHGAAN